MTAALQLAPSTHTPARTKAVIPDRSPSTPVASGGRALLALAGLVMLGVLLASISGIAEVAELVKMPKVVLPSLSLGNAPLLVPIGTIGLILAWDGLQVTAAWALHAGRDRAALILLVATATASGAAQGWAGVISVLKSEPNASWPFLLFVALVHASPAIALIGAEWLVFRAAARASRHGADPHLEVDVEPEPATPDPVEPVHEVALATVTPVRSAAPKPTTRKATAPGPDLDVVEKVRKALADMGATAHDVNRDQVLEHLRPGAPHATKVGAALRHLREQP